MSLLAVKRRVAQKRIEKRTEPLHNPLAPNALVLHKPQLFGEDKIAVVVDPVRKMRLSAFCSSI